MISWKRETPAKLTSAQADVERVHMYSTDVGVQRKEFAYMGLKHDLS